MNDAERPRLLLDFFFFLYSLFFSLQIVMMIFTGFFLKKSALCVRVCVCFDTRNKQTNKQMHRKKIDNKICLDNDDDDEGVIMNGIE